MINVILKNGAVAFVFGVIMALVAYFGNFPIPNEYIWVIPFFVALLNLIGSLAASMVVHYLAARHLVRERNLNIIGFATAAIVNTVVALVVVLRFADVFFHRELIFLYFAGMGMGVVYGMYRYRIDLINERVRFLEEISEKNRQLQEATRQLAITRERNRMGRELHDSISQGLHGLTFAIHSLRNKLPNPPTEVRNTLDHMEAAARSTLDELRAMIEELKPSLLTEKGLAEALKTATALFSQRQNIPAQVQLQIPEGITPEVEMAVYRITQEALANIEKHASAEKVSLSISPGRDHILLNIKDNGKGFDTRARSPGYGLRNMRLRAEEVEGSLTVVSRPNLGTSIVVSFPHRP